MTKLMIDTSNKQQTQKKTVENPEQFIQVVVAALQDKKGKEIVVMDLKNIKSAVADYFILCSGESDTQIKALADSVEDKVRNELSEKPWQSEGWEFRKWILLDYVNVIVHVFYPENRKFYSLEELWGDAEFTRYNDID